MATTLKLSEINRAFDAGAMAVDVLLDGIIGHDVDLLLDAPDAHDAVEWLLRVGATSVTVNPDRGRRLPLPAQPSS